MINDVDIALINRTFISVTHDNCVITAFELMPDRTRIICQCGAKMFWRWIRLSQDSLEGKCLECGGEGLLFTKGRM